MQLIEESMEYIMAHTDPFSIRLPKELYDDIFAVIAATGGEVTKSDIIHRAVKNYLALLRVNPTMLPNYNPSLDKAVTQPQKSVTQEDE